MELKKQSVSHLANKNIPFAELADIAARMIDLVKDLELREHATNMLLDGWCVMIEDTKYAGTVLWLQHKAEGKWM